MKVLSVFLWSALLLGVVAPACADTGDNRFGFDLYVRHAADTGNAFFSPYSISTALTMAYEGAHGQTADEMRAVLHLSSDDAVRREETTALIQRLNRSGKSYELKIANALWAQKDFVFLPQYMTMIEEVYGGTARDVDFVGDTEGVRLTINRWVADQTRNRIRDLLLPGSLDTLTRLVITNAVYFKGAWAKPFDKALTTKGDFLVSPDRKAVVEMMNLPDERLAYAEDGEAQILELPYKGNELSMLIVLPREKDLRKVAGLFSEAKFKVWREALREAKVSVTMPRFKCEARYQLENDLAGMGMPTAFNETTADFSGMTGKPNLYISRVLHKAWIEVDEKGSEAAAATAVVMDQLALPVNVARPKIFRADHPFFFVIEDKQSGEILFMGRVVDPGKGQ